MQCACTSIVLTRLPPTVTCRRCPPACGAPAAALVAVQPVKISDLPLPALLLSFAMNAPRLFLAQHLGALLHRLDDVDVAGAAAQVALEAVDDLVLGRARVVLEQA